MEYERIPIIIVLCYIASEIYKYVFRKNKDTYRLIPFISSLLGGIIGVLMYLSKSSEISEGNDIWIALGIGMVSGASATGTNQIIKQLFLKGRDNDVCK